MPQDPVMLLSYVNTLLRDRYDSLELFCEDHGVAPEEIVEKLRSINYEYDREQNAFR